MQKMRLILQISLLISVIKHNNDTGFT